MFSIAKIEAAISDRCNRGIIECAVELNEFAEGRAKELTSFPYNNATMITRRMAASNPQVFEKGRANLVSHTAGRGGDQSESVPINHNDQLMVIESLV